MDLQQSVIPSQTKYAGHGGAVITAGKSLKIETSPHGEEILDVEVPEGKQWTVSIDVIVVETDA